MPLAANALTTYAEVKADLGLADDSRQSAVERQINAASEAIERFCRRQFGRLSVVEQLAPSGTQRLVLARTPVLVLTSITADGDTLDPDEYRLESAEAGIVFRETGWPRNDLFATGIAADPVPGTGRPTLEVAYAAGYVLPKDDAPDSPRTLPFDLEEACIITAVSLYRARGSDRRIASESFTDASVGYGGVNAAIGRGAGGIIPDEAAVLLERYVRIL